MKLQANKMQVRKDLSKNSCMTAYYEFRKYVKSIDKSKIITVSDACKIAVNNAFSKRAHFSLDFEITIIIDCGDFYSIGFNYYEKGSDKRVRFNCPILEIDIAKVGGIILPLNVYRPWTDYGKKIDNGKHLEVPEEFREKIFF